MPSEADLQFAEFLIGEGVAPEADLRESLAAVDRIAALGLVVTLADVLAARGILSPEKTAGLLGVAPRRSEGGILGSRFDGLHLPADQERRLGELAVSKGWVQAGGLADAQRIRAALEIEGLKVPLIAILVDRAGLPTEAVDDLARKAAEPLPTAPAPDPRRASGVGIAPASGPARAPSLAPGGARPESSAPAPAPATVRASTTHGRAVPARDSGVRPAGARASGTRRGVSSAARRGVSEASAGGKPGLPTPILVGGALGLAILSGAIGFFAFRTEPDAGPRPNPERPADPRPVANRPPEPDPKPQPAGPAETADSAANAAIERVRVLMDAREPEQALAVVDEALAGPAGREEESRTRLERVRERLLEKVADAMLRRAQELVARDERGPAGELLRRVIERFAGTLHEDAARSMLDRLEGVAPGPGPGPGPGPRPGATTVSAEKRAKAHEIAVRALLTADHGDYEDAGRLAAEALAVDPNCPLAIGVRGNAIRMTTRGNHLAALQDLSWGIDHVEHDPVYWPWLRLKRMYLYMAAGDWRSVHEQAEAGLSFPCQRSFELSFRSLRGWARVNLGDVDGGLAEMNHTIEMDPQDQAMYCRWHAFTFQADWPALLEEAERKLRIYPDDTTAHFGKVRALVELGRYDEAEETIQWAQRQRRHALYLYRGFLNGTAAAGRHYDPDEALRLIRQMELTSTAEVPFTLGRILFQAERYHEAVQELESHGHLNEFEIVFLLGATHFKLGNLAEARKWLREARRLNSYIRRHAERISGLADYLDSLDRDAGPPVARTVRGFKVSLEAETAPLSVAEIETLVRRFEFERAVREYERHRDALESSERRAEAERRLAELRGLATCFRRFREKLDAGQIRDLKLRAGTLEVAVVRSAGGGSFEYSIPRGSGKAAWGALGIESMLEALQRAGPTPAESVALGFLAWDLAGAERGFELLRRGEKAGSAERAILDAGLAVRRGIAIPDGGFLHTRSRWVTPEEKKNLDAGLVAFEGQWVTPADREKLARGLIHVSGQWVPREEGELLRRGFQKYKDRWYSREEYRAIRSRWEAAYELSTEHYDIRTNRGDEFAHELGRVAEAAYRDLRDLYGGDEPRLPGKERMTLWAFDRFEDYRAYCVEHEHEDHLQAAGFASSNSNVVVGWNKTDSQQQFLQTMAHEAAHLYYFRVRPAGRPPSWYAESMATQLEGFEWTGKEYVFNRISHSRLSMLKQTIRKGAHLPLETLLAGNALELINSDSEKALVFYAESWALFHFLTHTNRADYREAFEKYRKAIDVGTERPFTEFFTDLKALEADLIRYVEAL